MKRSGLFLAVVVACVLFFSFCLLAQEDPKADIPRLSAVQGWVSKLDWVGNKIVINTGGDEITFHFYDDVQVEQMGESISINRINQGDQVTVHFIDKKHVGLIAISITDEAALIS